MKYQGVEIAPCALSINGKIEQLGQGAFAVVDDDGDGIALVLDEPGVKPDDPVALMRGLTHAQAENLHVTLSHALTDLRRRQNELLPRRLRSS